MAAGPAWASSPPNDGLLQHRRRTSLCCFTLLPAPWIHLPTEDAEASRRDRNSRRDDGLVAQEVAVGPVGEADRGGRGVAAVERDGQDLGGADHLEYIEVSGGVERAAVAPAQRLVVAAQPGERAHLVAQPGLMRGEPVPVHDAAVVRGAAAGEADRVAVVDERRAARGEEEGVDQREPL